MAAEHVKVLRWYAEGHGNPDDFMAAIDYFAALSAGGDVVATLLPRDNEFDEGDVGPYFSAKDWSALRHLPPGTKLYTTAPAGAGDAVDAAIAARERAYDNRDMALQAAEHDADDAVRYRWLREHFRFGNDSMREIWFDAMLAPDDGGDLDATIDACRKGDGL